MLKDWRNNKQYIITVALCCMMAAGTLGVSNAYSLFYSPMAELLNVGRGAVTMHMTICSLATSFAYPTIAKLTKKYNMRYLVIVAIALHVVAGLVMGLSRSIILINVMSLIRGISLSFCGVVTITAVIGNWFEKNTGTLTGFAMGFSGITGALLSPIFSKCITAFGYQPTYFGSYIITALCYLPSVFLLHFTPQSIGLQPFGHEEKLKEENKEEIVDSKNYLPYKQNSLVFILLVIMGIGVYATIALATHISIFATDHGHSASQAAFVLSIVMLANVTFKLLSGVLIDKIGVRKTGTIIISCCLLSIVTMVLFGTNYLIMCICAFFYGGCYCMSSVGMTAVIRQLYGNEVFSTAYSNLSVYTTVVYSCLMTVVGSLCDVTGSYNIPFLLIAAIGVIGVVLLNVLLAKAERMQKNA